MKTSHNDHSADIHSVPAQKDAFSQSLKDIARRIAVLVVRQHRRRKSGSGKKTG